ncbi:hypothetical protein NDU88_000123 [Pleurodeles waltl]|uniref:Uncharacterized protein n=1 Tax=Pleurodeles waltl TaxID=8319 RepID=A0AAV7UP39_PLEWA|nr:hypothetical protein NDU88_000123 [Pleurodeles waltl]
MGRRFYSSVSRESSGSLMEDFKVIRQAETSPCLSILMDKCRRHLASPALLLYHYPTRKQPGYVIPLIYQEKRPGGKKPYCY